MTLGSRLRNDGMTLSSNESLIHAAHDTQYPGE